MEDTKYETKKEMLSIIPDRKKDTKEKEDKLKDHIKYSNKFNISKNEFMHLTGEDEEFYWHFLLMCYVFKNASNNIRDYIGLTRDFESGITEMREYFKE